MRETLASAVRVRFQPEIQVMSLTSLQPGPTDNQIIAGGIFENQDAVLIVPKTIAQCGFAGCVFHGQDTVQGCCYQLLPVNSRLLAVSLRTRRTLALLIISQMLNLLFAPLDQRVILSAA